jgi:hypothetical protein
MNDNRTGTIVGYGVAGVAAVVIPLLLGGSLGWPTPVLVILILVLVVAVGVSAARTWSDGERRVEPFPQPPARPAVIAPIPPACAGIGPLAIASEDDAYRFRFTATVHWQQRADDSPQDRNWRQARAQEALLDRAINAARVIAPRDHTTAGARLAAVLSEPVVASGAGVQVWASDVGVDLAGEDSERLVKLERIRKDVRLWEQQREHERELRSYLGDDVLATSGKALVWWLARHEDDIRGAVDRIPDLARISSVAQGLSTEPMHDGDGTLDRRAPVDVVDPEEPQQHGAHTTTHAADEEPQHGAGEQKKAPADAALDMLDGLFPDDRDRARAARQLALVVGNWGHQELADSLVRRGVVPRDVDHPPMEPSDSHERPATSEPPATPPVVDPGVVTDEPTDEEDGSGDPRW